MGDRKTSSRPAIRDVPDWPRRPLFRRMDAPGGPLLTGLEVKAAVDTYQIHLDTLFSVVSVSGRQIKARGILQLIKKKERFSGVWSYTFPVSALAESPPLDGEARQAIADTFEPFEGDEAEPASRSWLLTILSRPSTWGWAVIAYLLANLFAHVVVMTLVGPASAGVATVFFTAMITIAGVIFPSLMLYVLLADRRWVGATIGVWNFLWLATVGTVLAIASVDAWTDPPKTSSALRASPTRSGSGGWTAGVAKSPSPRRTTSDDFPPSELDRAVGVPPVSDSHSEFVPIPHSELDAEASFVNRCMEEGLEAVGPRVGARCRDGWRSRSTGRGTCSHHGGVGVWLHAEVQTRSVRQCVELAQSALQAR